MFDTDAPAGPPPLDPASFERLRATLERDGPSAAVEALCAALRDAGHFDALFYAVLMGHRVRLGVAPFPNGPASEIPENAHEEYEETIREAARAAGGGYLAAGEIGRAWTYYRLINEPGPIVAALDAADPADGADIQPLIDVAFYQGVHPTRGFDLILTRYGVCNAITTVSSQDFSRRPELLDHCVKALVKALHGQIAERVRDLVREREAKPPADGTLGELVRERPFLFEDGAYHVDLSHLSAVVQFALQLPDCAERRLARDLCEYGRRLTTPYQSEGNPPFERQYEDSLVYLKALDGEEVEAGVAHFTTKAEAGVEQGETYPAEVLVNLLIRLGREREALAVARRLLSAHPEGSLSCPGVFELARRAGEMGVVAEVARERADGVAYLAALIAGKS